MDNSNKLCLKKEQLRGEVSDEDADEYDDHADDTDYNGDTRKGSLSQYFRWNPPGIAKLLQLRFEKDAEFNNKLKPKKNLWNEISEQMKQYGHIIPGEQCDLKFRNMMQTYKKNRMKELTGRTDFINWEYYKYFKEAIDNGSRIYDESLMDETTNDATAKKETKQDENPEITNSTVTRSFKKVEEKNSTKKTTNSNNFHIELPLKRKRISKDLDASTTSDYGDNNGTEESTNRVSTQNNSVIENKCNCLQQPFSDYQEKAKESDCKTFGNSVGVQMMNIRSACTRSLVKLKIQKILFLAETGKLDYCHKGESNFDLDS